jgi:hypothetical protein
MVAGLCDSAAAWTPMRSPFFECEGGKIVMARASKTDGSAPAVSGTTTFVGMGSGVCLSDAALCT